MAPELRAQFTLSTSADYSSGFYGETEKTKTFSTTGTVEYTHGRWTFKLGAPYLHVSGPGTVVPGIGKIVKSKLPPNRNEAGYGDTTASASYVVHQSGDGFLTMMLGGEAKFATANDAKGLGTGQNDYALHADIYRTWRQLTGFLTLGYRVLGSPPASKLLNTLYSTVGWSYQATEKTSVGLIYSVTERNTTRSTAQAEAMAFAGRKLGRAWNSQLYLLSGLTASSPDFGVGLSLSRAF